MKKHFKDNIIIYLSLGLTLGLVSFYVICHECTNTPYDPYAALMGGDVCIFYLWVGAVIVAAPLWIYLKFLKEDDR